MWHRRAEKNHSLGHWSGASVDLPRHILAGFTVAQLPVEIRGVLRIFLTDFVVAGGGAEIGFAARDAGGGDKTRLRVDISALTIEIDNHAGASRLERRGGEVLVENRERIWRIGDGFVDQSQIGGSHGCRNIRNDRLSQSLARRELQYQKQCHSSGQASEFPRIHGINAVNLGYAETFPRSSQRIAR